MKRPDLNLLTALDALLSEQSVTRAATRHYLSTPAMSHTLARLRDAIGDPLLVRAGRQMSLTPHATGLRGPVRRLVAEAQALLSIVGEKPLAGVQREFVVRAPQGVPIVYGAHLISALQQRMPLASLRFVPESEYDALALREGQIDLDIGLVGDRGPEVHTERLFAQRYVGAARQGHPIFAKRMSLRSFLAQQHVAVTQRARMDEPVDLALRAVACARRIALTVPAAYGALVAASQSALVAAVPARVVDGVAEALSLRMFELPFKVPADDIVQAWHPRLDADAPHRCLRHTVKAVLTRSPSPPLPAPFPVR